MLQVSHGSQRLLVRQKTEQERLELKQKKRQKQIKTLRNLTVLALIVSAVIFAMRSTPDGPRRVPLTATEVQPTTVPSKPKSTSAPPNEGASTGSASPKAPGVRQGRARLQSHPKAIHAAMTAPSPTDFRHEPRSPKKTLKAIIPAIQQWSKCWEMQAVSCYLDAYSTIFTPDNGMSLSEWREHRAAKISAPIYVYVDIGPIEMLSQSGRQATVRFTQKYASPSYRDRVEKTLVLALESGQWKIVHESSKPRT